MIFPLDNAPDTHVCMCVCVCVCVCVIPVLLCERIGDSATKRSLLPPPAARVVCPPLLRPVCHAAEDERPHLRSVQLKGERGGYMMCVCGGGGTARIILRVLYNTKLVADITFHCLLPSFHHHLQRGAMCHTPASSSSSSSSRRSSSSSSSSSSSTTNIVLES